MPESSFALDQWLLQHGLTKRDLEAWGVLVTPQALYVPVHTPGGRTAFYLIRTLAGQFRYRVSPKSARPNVLLYGFHRAASALVDRRQVVLVEGFSDVIALHKAALPQTVGVLGSSVSPAQLALATCLGGPNLVAFVDDDEAGWSLGERVLKFCPAAQLLAVQGVDPATAVRDGVDVVLALSLLATRYRDLRTVTFRPDLTLASAVYREAGVLGAQEG